jgi:hypothetical protein
LLSIANHRKWGAIAMTTEYCIFINLTCDSMPKENKEVEKEVLSYSLILHEARRKLDLSLNEYCVADSIYNLSNNPGSRVPGWCYASKKKISQMLGFKQWSIFNILSNLQRKGLIERDPETKYIKTTQLWYDTVILGKIKLKQKGDFVKNKDVCENHIGYVKITEDLCENHIPSYVKTTYNNNIYNNKKRERETLPLDSPKKSPEMISKSPLQEDIKQWGEFSSEIRKRIFEIYWKFVSVNATSGKILIGNPADIALKKALLSFSPLDISLAIIGFYRDSWHKDKNHSRPPVWFFSNDKILGECFGYFYSKISKEDQESYIKYIEGVLTGTTLIN